MSKLSTLKIKSLSKVGMHSDGNGLHLKIQLSKQTNTLNKSWIFRWGAQGKNTMGLGAYPIVSLATAREKTLECKRSVANGLNPRDERDKVKTELKDHDTVPLDPKLQVSSLVLWLSCISATPMPDVIVAGQRPPQSQPSFCQHR